MKNWTVTLLLFLTLAATAQTPAKAKAKPASPPPAPSAAPMPTAAEVNEFLRRMFGYDPNVTWKVQGVAPTDVPGVAHVVATIGAQSRPIHLYALPGGKFAVVGDLLPFGPDPFAPVRASLATQAKGVQRGSASAVVTVVEFSDLQCPFCRTAQPIIDRLIADMPETRLIFQPFPLPNHDWAMLAAAAAECAGRQKPDAFWIFINGVYADQANITRANLAEKISTIATTAGVDAKQLATCAATPAITQRIQQSIELGKLVGVNSTPTLFINGRKLTGISDIPYEQLKAIIAFEAAEARKQK